MNNENYEFSGNSSTNLNKNFPQSVFGCGIYYEAVNELHFVPALDGGRCAYEMSTFLSTKGRLFRGGHE